jgi:hypothetical protein
MSGNKAKWAMLITLFLMDIVITAALYYSILKSRVLLSGNDPFILNMVIILAIIGAALWVLTFFMVLEIRTDSSLHQRLVTIERLLMEKGFNSRR